MDKEEARFILRSFRADGSDAADPSFAEALMLAAEDRELGEWLARERASDAGFTDALGRLELPVTLRDEILTGLAAQRGDLPAADAWDAALIGALATVEPPAGLRSEILVAMKRSVGEPARAGSSWGGRLVRFGLPLAAAAGIVFALVITGDREPRAGVADSPGPGSIQPVSSLEQQLIAILEDDFQLDLKGPDFGVDPRTSDYELDLKDPKHEELFRMVRKELERACPQGCVPKGLRKAPGIGCKKLLIDGKRGAIVCFRRGGDDIVHLAVFLRDEVEGAFPIPEQRTLKQHGDWAVAEWKEKGRAFVLLGNTDVEHLGEVF
jgi:hypothetical protein